MHVFSRKPPPPPLPVCSLSWTNVFIPLVDTAIALPL